MEPDSIIGVILHFQMVEKKKERNILAAPSMGKHGVRANNGSKKKLTASPHLHWCFLGMPALT